MGDTERAALFAAARAYLEWEQELSGFGLPAFSQPGNVAARAGGVTSQGAQAPAQVRAEDLPAARAALPVPSAPPVPVAPARSVQHERELTQSGEGTRTTLAALADASAPAALSNGDKRVRLAQLEEQVRGCAKCELAKGRSKTVFARGNPDSPLVFIGEGPGQEEDREGLPFVGPAGKLLDRMIAAMGYGREDVYICNVVKCRPPGNRTPLPSEAGACAPFLLGQLEAVQPKVIVALGRCAAENLGLVQGGGWRGRWGTFQGVPVMPTYHPAFLLRSPEFKRPVWEDLQKVMQRLK